MILQLCDKCGASCTSANSKIIGIKEPVSNRDVLTPDKVLCDGCYIAFSEWLGKLRLEIKVL